MRQGRNVANSPEIKKIIDIVEKFIREKHLICYGGTAINNILPKQDQFYNMDIEIPDYDFFSHDALVHAKELADIYKKEGFIEIEAKTGQHHGTYKVFVNFIPVADITYLPKELFTA
jgi:23S rRNA A2030 N6-methylase RlmJ